MCNSAKWLCVFYCFMLKHLYEQNHVVHIEKACSPAKVTNTRLVQQESVELYRDYQHVNFTGKCRALQSLSECKHCRIV